MSYYTAKMTDSVNMSCLAKINNRLFVRSLTMCFVYFHFIKSILVPMKCARWCEAIVVVKTQLQSSCFSYLLMDCILNVAE